MANVEHDSDNSYLSSNSALLYEQGQRAIERKRTLAIQSYASNLQKASPGMGVDEALRAAVDFVDDFSGDGLAGDGKNPMASVYEANEKARLARISPDIREAQDNFKAQALPWATGMADPELDSLSVDELRERLRSTAEQALPDSHFSAPSIYDDARRERLEAAGSPYANLNAPVTENERSSEIESLLKRLAASSARTEAIAKRMGVE